METTSKMPPEIAKAVVSVMGKIRTIGKDNRNEHGRYNYVSVDKFYELVGPLLAEAGIFVMVDERKSEVSVRESIDNYGKVKNIAWLSLEYDVSIYHASGVKFGPVQRSIQVIASGPQAYASGVSFVEKYFLRSLFKIPTGDQDDVDAHAAEPLPATSAKHGVAPIKAVADTFDVDTSQTTRDTIILAIDLCVNEDQLRKLWIEQKENIRKLHETDRGLVESEKEARKQYLKGKAA